MKEETLKTELLQNAYQSVSSNNQYIYQSDVVVVFFNNIPCIKPDQTKTLFSLLIYMV